MTMHATTARLFATAKRTSQLVPSEAWGIDVELRGMTMGDRSTLLTDCYTQGADRQPIYARFYPVLLRACCYDPSDGAALFEGVGDDDINKLPATEVERIAGLCLKLSGLDKESETTLGNGSGGTTTITSATRLHATSGAPSKNSKSA